MQMAMLVSAIIYSLLDQYASVHCDFYYSDQKNLQLQLTNMTIHTKMVSFKSICN